MSDLGILAGEISDWILEYANRNSIQKLVVGVSGGVDSAVTSTLSAMTGLDTIVLNMPIHQDLSQYDLSKRHISWLEENWENVEGRLVDLTATFDKFNDDLKGSVISDLALANSRARLRMVTLYAIAGSTGGMVVGTGNRVEDFGVGFFTKYGDGGVDISPIADLYKSEVYALAAELGVLQEIRDAAPTDGLWDDGRTDEEQMGASYAELEWAMSHVDGNRGGTLSDRQIEVLKIYNILHSENLHKMSEIPVFKMRRD
tara:strand:+ start:80 stop:853 length:774 start_codon:yes stop_codon:yes gene_type:complete